MHLQPVAADGETVIARFRAHWHSLLIVPVVAAVASVIAYAATQVRYIDGPLITVTITALWLFAAIVSGSLVLTWLTTSYLLTDKKLVRAHGILKRQSLEIPLTEIASIRASQTLPERLLGYGDLTVETAGDSDSILTDIPHPKRFKRILSDAREQASARRGGTTSTATTDAPANTTAEIPAVDGSRRLCDLSPDRIPAPAAATPPAPVDQLQQRWDTVARLGPLVERGVLSPDEFDRAVRELTGGSA